MYWFSTPGAIVGIVIAVIIISAVAITLILCLLWICSRNRAGSNTPTFPQTPTSQSATNGGMQVDS